MQNTNRISTFIFALLIALFLIVLGVPQLQAASQTYTFTGLQAADTGGAGYKLAGDDGSTNPIFAVSNDFTDEFVTDEIYHSNASLTTAALVIKADGTNYQSFQVEEMSVYDVSGGSIILSTFTLTFKNAVGGTISTKSLSGNYNFLDGNPVSLATIYGSFLPVDGAAEIEMSITTSPSFVANLTFKDMTLDLVPSVSTITRADANPTNATSVDFTVTFSDSVTGVDTSDFSLTKTDTADGSVSNVSGSGSSYTVTVNSITGDGTLRLDVTDDDTITNGTPLGGTGTGNGNFTSGEEYTIAEPTYVELLEGSFKASGSYLPDFDLYYTEINWDSGMELNNAFFVILKRGEEEGEYEETKVWWCDGGNDEIDCETGWEHAFNIPAQGDGWSYQVFDTEVRKGKTYYYKLMDVELDGDSTEHDESIIEATIPE